MDDKARAVLVAYEGPKAVCVCGHPGYGAGVSVDGAVSAHGREGLGACERSGCGCEGFVFAGWHAEFRQAVGLAAEAAALLPSQIATAGRDSSEPAYWTWTVASPRSPRSSRRTLAPAPRRPSRHRRGRPSARRKPRSRP